MFGAGLEFRHWNNEGDLAPPLQTFEDGVFAGGDFFGSVAKRARDVQRFGCFAVLRDIRADKVPR